MNFIEISPGKLLRKSEIIDIARVDDTTCKLATQIGVYDCEYPSWYILMKLEEQDVAEPLPPLQTSDNRINLWGNQYWAG